MPVAFDAGVDNFLDLHVHRDAEGVRLAPANDAEGREFSEAVRTLFVGGI